MNKGWYEIPGEQEGDRTLEQQLIGLPALLPSLEGKSVLELGCAEGLMTRWFSEAGAARVDAIELVPGSVALARDVCAECRGVTIIEANLNHFAAAQPQGLRRRYDLVAALAIVHKLADPCRFLKAVAPFVGKRLVFRAPRLGPVWSDWRSGDVEIDTEAELARHGLRLAASAAGPNGEWTGVFKR